MNAPASERTSAATTGWLVVLLMVGWLAFVFVPWPTKAKAGKAPPEPTPPSGLVQAGLRDYTDWDGLPEIFAIWADRAQWKDGRTRFAYWHPVMKTYSYFFEVVRTEGKFHFTEIPEPKDDDFYWDESLGEECPIRFYKASPMLKRIDPPPMNGS